MRAGTRYARSVPRLPLLAAAVLCIAAMTACAAPLVPAPSLPVSAPEHPVSRPPPTDAPGLPPAFAAPAIRGPRGDLTLVTLDGAEVKLADYGAKVTVISIWGTGCVPCIRELPYIEALYKASSGDREVSVLTLVVDDVRDPAKTQAVREIATRLGLSVPVLFDRDIRLYRRLNGEEGPQGKKHEGIVLPQLVIIDSSFTVRRHFGFKGQQTVAEFVAAQRALIELARTGQLPPEDQVASPPPRPSSATLAPPRDRRDALAELSRPMHAAGAP